MKQRAEELNGLAAQLFLNSEFGKAALEKRETEAKRIEAARELREVRAGKKDKVNAARINYLVSEEGVAKARAEYDAALSRRADQLQKWNVVVNEIERKVQELSHFLKLTAPADLVQKREALQRDLEKATSTPRDQYVSGGNAEANLQLKLQTIETIQAEIADIEAKILDPERC